MTDPRKNIADKLKTETITALEADFIARTVDGMYAEINSLRIEREIMAETIERLEGKLARLLEGIAKARESGVVKLTNEELFEIDCAIADTRLVEARILGQRHGVDVDSPFGVVALAAVLPRKSPYRAAVERIIAVTIGDVVAAETVANSYTLAKLEAKYEAARLAGEV